MNNQKIEKLLDHLTLGLKADPETRLEVKSELRSHLEDKIEEGIKEGLTESESVEQALKAFGDTIQISDEIADANNSKMSVKARLRVLAGFLLVPLVIICALITFVPSEIVSLAPHKFLNIEDFLNVEQNSSNKVFWIFERYTPEEKFILYGDTSRKSKADRQKAISERYPENKIFLANYIITLLFEKKSGQEVLAELELAKQKDPDNAFYNYMTAGLLLEKACKLDSKTTYPKKSGKRDYKNAKTTYTFEVKDRKLMDKAVEEYLAGTQKKYCKAYVVDMLQSRFDIMGKPQSFIENIRQIATAAGVLLPYLNKYRSVSKRIWKYADVLQKEGKQEKALQIISPWKTYLKQITENSDFLIDILVDMAVAKIGENFIPAIYRKAGKIKEAEKSKLELTKICEVKDHWRENIGNNCIDKELLNKAGIMAGMLLPALGKIDFKEEDFTVSKKIEYIVVEKSLIILLNAFFLLIMIVALLTALFWRIRSGQKALLLASSPKFVGKVFLMGIIIPIAIYGLISIMGIVGGHEYNIKINGSALLAQMIMLFTAIPFIIYNMTKKHTRLRCLKLGIAYPEKNLNKIWKAIFIVIFSIFTAAALIPPRFLSTNVLIVFAIVTGVIFVLGIITLIARYFLTIFGDKKYALYYGALAKTIAPVFALAMVFMTIIVIPCLNWREADLINKDKVMYGQPRSFTHIEYNVTQKLKAQMLKALD